MKAETVEEFLARGGQIERLEYVEPKAVVQKLKPTNLDNTIYDLGYGELLYGSRYKSKNKKSLAEKLQKVSLPPEILQRIKEKLK
jgi:hypothetical protein